MIAVLILGGIGLALGGVLWAARAALAGKREQNANELVDAVDALLPQTQCAQCGYPGCRPYAVAVAAGAPTDLCAPGGSETATKVRRLVGGMVGDAAPPMLPEPGDRVARIDAEVCVGCALCAAACPVDAIAGAPQYLHAVVAEHCTGCELCVAPCPVDCIDMADRRVASAPPAQGAPDEPPVAFPPLASPTSAAIVERVDAAGVVGMGGAGYPAALKLRAAIAAGADCVIGNGLAGESGVSADAALLRQRFKEVVAGLSLVGRCLPATPARLVLAVPPGSRLPPPAEEVNLPFPAGEERRLVERVTGRRPPPGGHPTDAGVVVFNVATLFAIYEAVTLGRAPRRRLVTVNGEDQWLAIGTPIARLPMLTDAGPGRVNGALAGRSAAADERVRQTTFAIGPPRPPPLPCIGCGWCDDACPEGLSPRGLHEAFDATTTADVATTAAEVSRCIECGACTAACPSAIDLVGEFRELKRRANAERLAASRAAAARSRWLARERRFARRAGEAGARRRERMRTPRQW